MIAIEFLKYCKDLGLDRQYIIKFIEMSGSDWFVEADIKNCEQYCIKHSNKF